MPSRLIEWQKATFTDPNKIGDSLGGRTVTGEFPLFKSESAAVAFSYVVPAGKVINLKNLLINVLPPACLYKVAGAYINLGSVYFLVDGTTKWEGRLVRAPMNAAGVSWTEDWRQRCCPLLNIGEGIDFTSGQVLKLQINPLAPATGQRLAMKCSAVMHGKAVTGGAVDMQKGVIFSPEPGAARDILSYTVPANGFRLFSARVDAWISEPVCASVQVFVNGACVIEAAYLSFDGERTVFGAGNPGLGVFPIMGPGAWGMKLSHGDRVDVLGHAFLDYGQELGVQMAAMSTTETYPAEADVKDTILYGPNETDMEGDLVAGGGGNTYSRGRVVNG
jgi:hypothetical protein